MLVFHGILLGCTRPGKRLHNELENHHAVFMGKLAANFDWAMASMVHQRMDLPYGVTLRMQVCTPRKMEIYLRNMKGIALEGVRLTLETWIFTVKNCEFRKMVVNRINLMGCIQSSQFSRLQLQRKLQRDACK